MIQCVSDDGKTVVTETLTTVDPETSKVSFTEGHTTESLANGNVYKKRFVGMRRLAFVVLLGQRVTLLVGGKREKTSILKAKAQKK